MKSKKILSGVVVLILIGLAVVYYSVYRGKKNDDSKNKPSINDSTTRTNEEPTPYGRGTKPEKNSADGSVKMIEEFVKANAKNPETIEFLEWSDVSSEQGYWKVRCKYRGISSFGAAVTTNAWFYIKNDKVVYSKIISKI